MTLSDAFGLPAGSESVKFSVFEIKALRNAEVKPGSNHNTL